MNRLRGPSRRLAGVLAERACDRQCAAGALGVVAGVLIASAGALVGSAHQRRGGGALAAATPPAACRDVPVAAYPPWDATALASALVVFPEKQYFRFCAEALAPFHDVRWAADVGPDDVAGRDEVVLVGEHVLLPWALALPTLPLVTILSTEQLSVNSTAAAFAATVTAAAALRPAGTRLRVAEYSTYNARVAAALGVTVETVLFHPVPPEPALRGLVAAGRKTHDFVFFGSLSPRRDAVIAAVRAAGHTVLVLDGEWGAERDREVARARAILNVHFRDDYTVFEVFRCGRWIAAGMRVVTEAGHDTPQGHPLVSVHAYAALLTGRVSPETGRAY